MKAGAIAYVPAAVDLRDRDALSFSGRRRPIAPERLLLRACIFDVDGVLLASPHERAWREALAGLTDPASLTTAFYQAHIAGLPRADGAAAGLRALGLPATAAAVAEYSQRKQARLEALVAAGAVPAFPDALRFIGTLERLGWPLAAASSSLNADAMLAGIRLADGRSLRSVFAANTCGRPVRHGKPDPEIFLIAAAELGMPPESCLVAEDALAGIAAAQAAGMATVGLARLDDAALLAAADLVVASFDEIDAAALAEGRLARLPKEP